MAIPNRRGAETADLVFFALTAASIVPFWVPDLLALTDWPHHLAAASIIRDFEAPQRHLSTYYDLALAPRPYLGLTYLLLALGKVMPLSAAGRVVLSLYALMLCFSVQQLVKSADRDPRLSWFAPLFVHNWAIAYGFVPFALSLPFAIRVAAQLRSAHGDSGTGLGPSHLLTQGLAALMHPLGWALSIVAALPLAPALRATDRRRFFLATILVFAFVLGANLWTPTPERLSDLAIETRWRWQIKHMVVGYSLAYFPGWLDSLIGFAGVGALVALVATGLANKETRSDPIDRTFLAMLAVYLVAPVSLSFLGLRISLLAPRLAVPLCLFLIPVARGRRASLFLLGGVAALGHAALVTSTHLDFSSRWASQLEQTVSSVPQGAKLFVRPVPLDQSVLNPKKVRPPESALHLYALIDSAGFDPGLFSTPQSPVRIRASAPLPTDRAAYDIEWVQTSSTVELVAHRGEGSQ